MLAAQRARKSSLWFLRMTMALRNSDIAPKVTTPHTALPGQWPSSRWHSGSSHDRQIVSIAMHRNP